LPLSKKIHLTTLKNSDNQGFYFILKTDLKQREKLLLFDFNKHS